MLLGLGIATFIVDAVATTRAADAQGLPFPSVERTVFINDYRGARSSAEIGGVILGVGLMAVANAAQARRAAVYG